MLVENIRAGFNNLRMKRALTDVVFIPRPLDETGDSVGDEPGSGNTTPLVAHRSFLAVFSEYFADAFCGGYRESTNASSENPVPVNVTGYSRDCVQLVLGRCFISTIVNLVSNVLFLLDYIYTGVQSIHDAHLELLLEAIGLSGYWCINDLFEAMQREIIHRKLFSPLSLDQSKPTQPSTEGIFLIVMSSTRCCHTITSRDTPACLCRIREQKCDTNSKDQAIPSSKMT